jgi:hypothetical protein
MTIINTKKHPDKRRVDGNTTVQDAIQLVSDNIIGNWAWLIELATTRQSPAFTLRLPIGHFFSIDDMGIYGESLWKMFKHTLDGDLDRFCALSEALQGRIVTAADIREAAREPLNKTLKEALLAKAGIPTLETSETKQPGW